MFTQFTRDSIAPPGMGPQMKKFVLSFALLIPIAASAADMPLKAPPAVVPQASSWTGWYVGGNVGYGWNDARFAFSPNDDNMVAATGNPVGIPPGSPMTPASFKRDGWVGGIQGGYNWQFNPKWVLGFEADYQLTGMSGSGSNPPFLIVGVPTTIQTSQAIRSFGTVRGRLGWLPSSNWMVYATGGFAYARVNTDVVLNAAGFVGLTTGVLAAPGQPPDIGFTCLTGPNCFTGHSSRTATGWTAGGGSEYKISENVSVKAEYLYVNLGDSSVVGVAQVSAIPFCPGCSGAKSSFTAKSTTDFQLARVGLNWKFSQGN